MRRTNLRMFWENRLRSLDTKQKEESKEDEKRSFSK